MVPAQSEVDPCCWYPLASGSHQPSVGRCDCRRKCSSCSDRPARLPEAHSSSTTERGIGPPPATHQRRAELPRLLTSAVSRDQTSVFRQRFSGHERANLTAVPGADARNRAVSVQDVRSPGRWVPTLDRMDRITSQTDAPGDVKEVVGAVWEIDQRAGRYLAARGITEQPREALVPRKLFPQQERA